MTLLLTVETEKHEVDLNGQYEGFSEFDNAYHSKTETVQLLIEHGADVTARDESHMTSLHLASSFVVPEMVRRLLEHGGCVTAQDKDRRTALHLASSWVSATAVILVSKQR